MIEDGIKLEELWDFNDVNVSEFNSVRNSIKAELKAWLKSVSTRKRYVKELKAIQGKSQFESLLNELTHEVIFHNMGVSRLSYTANKPCKLTPANKNPRGNQPEPETSILLRKTCDAVSAAVGKKCGLYQNAGRTCEGLTISISRIVAKVSQTDLSEDIRRHVEKARNIKSFH